MMELTQHLENKLKKTIDDYEVYEEIEKQK
jgi:hypothetical protein